jgi:hypothetical protein
LAYLEETHWEMRQNACGGLCHTGVLQEILGIGLDKWEGNLMAKKLAVNRECVDCQVKLTHVFR